MDRQQTEMLFAEAQRLRSSLVDASVKLAVFTKQLRDLLDLNDPQDKEEPDHER